MMTTRYCRRLLALACGALLAASAGWKLPTPAEAATPNAPGAMLRLHARRRIPIAPGSDQFKVVEQELAWDPHRTAIIICDMWNQHWCKGATRRVAEMAPRMNAVINAARARGVLIIHCPSDTMKHYEGWPERRLAQAAPRAPTKVPLQNWCALQDRREPALPIDDSDGGCDDTPQCQQGGPWTQEIDTLEIKPGDAITDSLEAYYLMQQRGIENVIIMGVHVNMCVLGRPFGIRQMVRQGKHVALMRDLTDSMYNSRMRPYVSHFRGTELVVEHIEKYWCPSITSADFLGGPPFHFEEDVRPRVVFLINEPEYHTAQTLSEFARSELEYRGIRCAFATADPKDTNSFSGLEKAMRSADLLVVSVRRHTPPARQMELIRRWLEQGKPLVGIRTASHAFAARPPDERHQAWPSFDRDVLGAHYLGHFGNVPPHAPLTRIQIIPAAKENPILTGIPETFASTAHLYIYRGLADSATPLLQAHVDGKTQIEPLAWINTGHHRRVFYTSMGNPDDFKSPIFRRLLLNGILWALHQPIPPAERRLTYSQWQPMGVPGTWERNSGGALASYDGMAWYRCQFEAPKSWDKGVALVNVEHIDNAHELFLNGERIGSAGAFPPNYQNGIDAVSRYPIPPGLLQPGEKNLIAIRVYDDGGQGGFKGAAPSVQHDSQEIVLKGRWQFRTGDDLHWANPEDARAGEAPVFRAITAAAHPAASAAGSLTHDAKQGPLSPAESLRRFQVPDDLEIDQIAAEPAVKQPVFLNFDERGRMWVVQYIQYPKPAGLKLVSRDEYWRAVYDKVPPPPPHQFRGKDRITILEDTHGDGQFDRVKTFLDGLNIATAVERGRGGVWVLNPPYLLFYPDKNNDDIPDGDPQVVLSGFGLEDTHSVVNSLRWGPDGWLYAAQGSTVSGKVIRPGLDRDPIQSMGQLIWRYQPETKRYEIFSEGGGNTFGVEIDSKGRIFSGHNGGNTRGFHYMQGAYLQKGFSKHGPLSNPYAFGYFPPMRAPDVERFSHTFLICEGGALPARYAGKLFGCEPLQGRIVESQIIPDGSTFRTVDLGFAVTTSDQWFRPVDIKLGPDGAVYIADWYDQQINHYRSSEGRVDPSNGRIYRLRAKNAAPMAPFDLSKLTSAQLVGLLSNPNRWFRQTALRLIGDRKDPSIIPLLRRLIAHNSGQIALEALWAIHLSGGFNDALALETLKHPNPFVRAWTVRLLADDRTVSPPLAAAIARLAQTEPNVETRAQIACSAKRLPASEALPIMRNLMARDEDVSDPRLPLLIWWALESKAESSRDQVLALFSEPAVWELPLVRQYLLERIMRRYAMAGTRQDLLACARLLDQSPGPQQTARLMAGFEAAFQGRSLALLPDELAAAIARHGAGSTALKIRLGDPAAVQSGLAELADWRTPAAARLQDAQLFGEVKTPAAVPLLLKLVEQPGDPALRRAALASLKLYDEPEIGQAVARRYLSFSPELRLAADSLIAARPVWSLEFLNAVASGAIQADRVPPALIRDMQRSHLTEIKARIQKIWPRIRKPTTVEMDQEISRVTQWLASGSGDPYQGKKLFTVTCAVCHRLFGEGAQIGPDLTPYRRNDLDTLLLNIVNPNAEIREGFETFDVAMKDGRRLTGFLADQDPRVVVLRGLDGQSAVLDRKQITSLKPTGVSLMPEGLLDALTPAQIRDLFAYLRSSQPLNN